MKTLTLTLALMLGSSATLAAMNTSSGSAAMTADAMNHAAHMTEGQSMAMNMNMAAMSEVGMPANGVKPDKIAYVLLADDMTIRFKQPVEINANDVVQFVIINSGQIEHGLTIGSHQEQLAFREMMSKMNGQPMPDSGSSVTVAPGKAKQLIWHFHGDNQVELACNLADHAAAGMTLNLTL